MALNCLVFEKIALIAFWRQTNRQTEEHMDSTDALSRSRCRERRLRRTLGGAHVPPTKVFRRLTASVNETLYKHASLQRWAVKPF